MKKILYTNILLVLLILIVLETAARVLGLSNLMGTQGEKIVKRGPDGIHYLKPNSEGLVFDKKIYTDKNGYRIPHTDYSYKNKKKIFIIGDSVALGVGAKEEKTFAGLMRSHLDNYEIYNSSVMGYQILQFEKTLNNVDKFLPINKIFYFLTLNDVLQKTNVENVERENTSTLIEKNKKYANFHYFAREINVFLRNKSYFYMYLKGAILDPSKSWFQNIHTFYSNNQITNLEQFVNLLIDKANKVNSELYIVVLPYEFQTRKCNESDFLPQKIIKEIMMKNNVNFFDFAPDFCKNKNAKKLFYKYDPMHLSVEGHDLVFNKIKNEINF